MTNYVYIKTEQKLYTVGFYDPHGKFQSESDHTNPNEAANRVAYLNGGNGSPHSLDHTCAVCGVNWVNVHAGYDTCAQCTRKT